MSSRLWRPRRRRESSAEASASRVRRLTSHTKPKQEAVSFGAHRAESFILAFEMMKVGRPPESRIRTKQLDPEVSDAIRRRKSSEPYRCKAYSSLLGFCDCPLHAPIQLPQPTAPQYPPRPGGWSGQSSATAPRSRDVSAVDSARCARSISACQSQPCRRDANKY